MLLKIPVQSTALQRNLWIHDILLCKFLRLRLPTTPTARSPEVVSITAINVEVVTSVILYSQPSGPYFCPASQ